MNVVVKASFGATNDDGSVRTWKGKYGMNRDWYTTVHDSAQREYALVIAKKDTFSGFTVGEQIEVEAFRDENGAPRMFGDWTKAKHVTQQQGGGGGGGAPTPPPVGAGPSNGAAGAPQSAQQAAAARPGLTGVSYVAARVLALTGLKDHFFEQYTKEHPGASEESRLEKAGDHATHLSMDISHGKVGVEDVLRFLGMDTPEQAAAPAPAQPAQPAPAQPVIPPAAQDDDIPF
jgi:hypothetical protein